MATTGFTTELIQTDDLPEADSINYQPLDRHHASTLLIISLLSWAGLTTGWSVIITVTGLAARFSHGYLLYLLPLIALPIIIFFCRLAASLCGYAVREQDVHYRSGIFWRGETSLPFNRIQHVEITRDILDRFFGLSKLKFFAAGGGSADLTIPALREEEAIKLRAFILEKVGADHNDD
ncbi:PH domain-containing protein [Kordiimonas gwangyangensis]|uniref:PH domain-containing protein n=1 Tax=Kordiimonas gwangyangensis TaxID=288022 RepID=UPI0003708D7C|nr:PH domain-containing protein [Kordiimonas gwangyangensis]